MKKNICIGLLYVFSSIVFLSCNNTIDHENSDSKVIETENVKLPAGYRWSYAIPAGEGSCVNIINSQEELKKFLSCGDGTIPSIDFSKESLLLAYGDTLSSIKELTHKLVQIDKDEFRLEVEIKTGEDAWQEGWTISVLIPKIPQSTTIQLKESRINDRNPGKTENPYMSDITGKWKLDFQIMGIDSIDLSKDDILYDFRKDGKVVISGNPPKNFKNGEYSYEYKALNICPTCTRVFNLKIGNDDALFCEPLILNNRMIITSNIKAEQDDANICNSFFIKMESDEPSELEKLLTDLPWLKEIIDEIRKDAEAGNKKHARIYQCTYRDGKGFLLELCVDCPDSGYWLRSQNGESLCILYGHAGDNCQELSVDFENKTLIWEMNNKK